MSLDEAAVAFAGVAGQAALLRGGELSSVELVDLLLRRIDRLDAQLNAFRVVFEDTARAEAAAADDARAAGDDRPLLGVPVAVKDNVDVAGHQTLVGTGSRQPAARLDAELVRRLRAAGMVLVGKTNLPELALWGFTESRTHGVTGNPWAPDRVPGGSSGGSAAAVAAGMVPAAHATDGGGSIRIPAAACGLVGLKPTHGLVPMEPDPDHWYGMSHAGFLTRRVEDTALLLDTCVHPSPGFTPLAAPPPLRVGWSTRLPVRDGSTQVHPDVVAAVEQVVALLAEQGHRLQRCDPPYGDVLRIFIPRYLRGTADDRSLLAEPGQLEGRTRTIARLGRLVGRRALARSAARGELLTARMRGLFGSLDVLVTPTTSAPPIRVAGADTGTGTVTTLRRMTRYVPYTQPWNITGQPAVSVPAYWTARGLPVGVQLVGRHGEERTLLQLAAQLEAKLDWPSRRPPVAS